MTATEFILPCIIMGLGIGADVAIATVVRSQQLSGFKLTLFWLIGVTMTHTLFPMVGYLLTYFSIQALPLFTPLIGFLAFSFIGYFLWQELTDFAANQDQANKPESQLMISCALILAISWDALWSGPAKSAQVVGWHETLIWLSFVVVGLVVAICALLALLCANILLSSAMLSENSMKLGLWLQYSVLSYFGLLALLRYTFSLEVESWQVFLVTATFTAMSMEYLLYNQKKRQSQLPLTPPLIASCDYFSVSSLDCKNK